MACRQQYLLLLQLTPLIWLALAAAAAAASGAKSDCPEKCGNVSIPFPFGIGDGCHIGKPWFNLSCNGLSNPAKPYWDDLEILNISLQGQLTFSSPVAEDCYTRSGRRQTNNTRSIRLDNDAPFTLSSTRTKFVAIGCDTDAYIHPFNGTNDTTGCRSTCQGEGMVGNNSCSGIGCCQASIPSGVKYLQMSLNSFNDHGSVLDFNPCSYAFLIEKDHFEFSSKDLLFNNKSERDQPVPAVLDWTIANQTCKIARRDAKTFACESENSLCNDTDLGYRCDCEQGYRGNPYLTRGDGCVDIDECHENLHNCGEKKCKNTKGGYTCKRPFDKFVALMMLLGIVISLLFILVIYWIYWGLKRRKIIKLRDDFFQKNGGLLLQQQIALHGVTVATKIFSAEELEMATNKYDQTQIIGRGGYGTVYKGILPNHGTVAIKKSKIVDESQIEQFINEVFILSQINHRNIVKLLGCCLETEVPLLVYEFISNGTLFNHIHQEVHPSTLYLSLEDRLRIASETAGALAYLHFAASIPIFHRDVKSTNILLDKDLTAKVSDFGASRLIPLDQTQISTIVQGTLGYLDPEYLQTGQLTEKSDVYSFGVVLVELLTGEKPTSFTRSPEVRNLSMYFLLAMKENSLFNVLDPRVVDEGGVEQLMSVSQLARRCLSLYGEERPTMKEVAIELAVELEELKRSFAQPRAEGKYEGTKVEPGQPSEAYRGNDNVVGQDSLGNRSISLVEIGR